MISRLVFTLMFFHVCFAAQAQAPKAVLEKVGQHWLELHNHFEDTSDVWGNYTLDLTLEALLMSDHYLETDIYTNVIKEVFRKRQTRPSDTINYKSQPFCSINFTLAEVWGEKTWSAGFIHESYRMYHQSVKSSEGAIMLNHESKHRVLIDYLQEYASRLAKTGYLTDDHSLYSESVNQFIIYEKLVKNDDTGLWSQGRGWCEDSTLISQGAWSRGHGWLLRGIVSTMLYLPDEYQSDLLPVLKRLADSILKTQAESGMYHILLNLPPTASQPDVSGSGMIAFYMALAVQEDWLDAEIYQPRILKATTAIKEYISDKGEILSSSKGPGPLCNESEYIGYIPETDEKHGFQGAIYGMIAEILMTHQQK